MTFKNSVFSMERVLLRLHRVSARKAALYSKCSYKWRFCWLCINPSNFQRKKWRLKKLCKENLGFQMSPSPSKLHESLQKKHFWNEFENCWYCEMLFTFGRWKWKCTFLRTPSQHKLKDSNLCGFYVWLICMYVRPIELGLFWQFGELA